MIGQAILDFFRDLVVNWISGIDSLMNGIDATAAGAGAGGLSAQAGHFLALFISPGVWPAVVSAWAVWLGLWLTTGVIAIFARRGKAT